MSQNDIEHGGTGRGSEAGLMHPPAGPVALPPYVPRALAPYQVGRSYDGGTLLHMAAAMTLRHPDDVVTALGREELADRYCRAALGCLRSVAADAGETDVLDRLSLSQELWCALPLLAGHVAARSVVLVYREHSATEGDPLCDMLDELVTQIWPSGRSLLPLSRSAQSTLSAGLEVQRYVSHYDVLVHWSALLDVVKVATRTTWADRQAALFHLIRSVQNSVAADSNRQVALGLALLRVLNVESD